jgi:hypothetical protein
MCGISGSHSNLDFTLRFLKIISTVLWEKWNLTLWFPSFILARKAKAREVKRP